MTIPNSQFEIFMVEEIIDGKLFRLGNIYQTFQDAYNKISKAVKGATLFEVASDEDNFHIDYYLPVISASQFGGLRCKSRHFRITFNLFTYDSDKPLVTEGDHFYWCRNDNKYESNLY